MITIGEKKTIIVIKDDTYNNLYRGRRGLRLFISTEYSINIGVEVLYCDLTKSLLKTTM